MVKLGRPEGTCKECNGKILFISNIWIHAKSRQRLCPKGKGTATPK